ncbi:hypothetical protein [Ferrovum sp.]|uniref:hypothetical protein n=1 Tax=Ferrovum sp. TaxID=2609467 RepID=UPI00260FD4EE|nr:hypothetical protein [Ferrovum sp.]
MAKRGRKKLSDEEKRRALVKVFFRSGELAALDQARGPRGRSEHIRMNLAGAVPNQIPAINIQTATNLGRSLGNLSTLAAAARKGGFIPDRDLLPALIELRNLLLTGKAHLTHAGDEE